MNMRKFANDERAISNLIATLILIAVAVVGGAFAYTAFRDQAQSTTTSADLQVQDLTAQDVGGTVYCSTTLKNVGTQRLSDIEVVIDPGGAGELTLDGVSALDPGQTGSDDDSTPALNAGETYAVRISATTPDDGSITKTMTVRVKS